ncbi:MAG: RibD family protein [Cohaesibacteraceae bacterium]
MLAVKSGKSRLKCVDCLPEERGALELYGALAEPSNSMQIFAQIGQSIDGRVATVSEDSRDVSGRDGLAHLHRLRALADAVVIGVKTAVQDSPQLTVRLAQGDNPARVVIAPRGRLPNDARLLHDERARRIVIQACDVSRPAGVEVVRLERGRWFAAQDVAAALADLGFRKVLVEGGGITIAQFLEAGLLDRLHIAIAPLLIGSGPQGLSTTSPVPSLAQALRPETHVYNLGSDILFDCVLAGGGQAAAHWADTADPIRAYAAG